MSPKATPYQYWVGESLPISDFIGDGKYVPPVDRMETAQQTVLDNLAAMVELTLLDRRLCLMVDKDFVQSVSLRLAVLHETLQRFVAYHEEIGRVAIPPACRPEEDRS